MIHKVSVVKKIMFLLMTMALAVAMVACSGAAGTPGPARPGKDAPTPDPTELTDPLDGWHHSSDGASSRRSGDARTVDLSGYFSDPQGQTLTYAATSSMTTYATVDGRPDDGDPYGDCCSGWEIGTITVTATNTDGLTADADVHGDCRRRLATTPEPETPEPDPVDHHHSRH